MTETTSHWVEGEPHKHVLTVGVANRKASNRKEGVVTEGAERIEEIHQQLLANREERERLRGELLKVRKQMHQWHERIEELLREYGDGRG